DYIKLRYRDEFREAFTNAFSLLSSQQRNVLRLHLLDGVTLEQLAATFGVHRSTIARWLAESRAAVLQGTRKGLRTRLRIAPAELESLIGLLRSQLDVSLHGLLTRSSPPR